MLTEVSFVAPTPPSGVILSGAVLAFSLVVQLDKMSLIYFVY